MNFTDKLLRDGPRTAPLAAADIPVRWLHQVREMVVRDGHKLRAGFPACIDVLGPNGYQPLMLPNSGIEFTGKRDRDAVLDYLTGRAPLPSA